MTARDEETQIAAVVAAMYEMISGPAGPRDWSRQQDIFHPDARLMRTGVDAGKSWRRTMSLDDYRTNVTPIFMAHGFFETELSHRINVFGAVAHVWSAYEARINESDATPERRGVNSIQLYRDATGCWRIISMIWDNEREALKAPAPGALKGL